jgi:spermidine/putrescine transport system permease protein
MATFFAYSFLTAGLFSVAGPLTLDAYARALGAPINALLAGNAAATGLLAATATVAIALPVAYWLRYAAGRWQVPVLFVVTGSMFASYLVRIYAWRTILGENGLINRTLEGLGIVEAPLGFLLYNRFSVTVALVHIFLPYVVLMLHAGFRPLEPALLEAAEDLGAGTLRRWTHVILPLMAAPAAAAFLFVFVLSASDYVTPQLIGGTGGLMLGVQIQASFTAIGDWPQGAAISFLMLLGFLACALAVLAGLRLLGLDRIRWAL